MLSNMILFATGMAAGGALVTGMALLLWKSTQRSGDINFENHVLALKTGMWFAISIIIILNGVLWVANALIPYLNL